MHCMHLCRPSPGLLQGRYWMSQHGMTLKPGLLTSSPRSCTCHGDSYLGDDAATLVRLELSRVQLQLKGMGLQRQQKWRMGVSSVTRQAPNTRRRDKPWPSPAVAARRTDTPLLTTLQLRTLIGLEAANSGMPTTSVNTTSSPGHGGRVEAFLIQWIGTHRQFNTCWP